MVWNWSSMLGGGIQNVVGFLAPRIRSSRTSVLPCLSVFMCVRGLRSFVLRHQDVTHDLTALTASTATQPTLACSQRCDREVCCVTWHGKGDYLASVSRGQSRRAVMIHQVSKASTQCPFRKTKVRFGSVRCGAVR